MGDLLALDAHRRVAEQNIIDGEPAEEWAPFAHDDRNEVDRHLVEQPELEALSSDGAGGDGNGAIAGDRSGLFDSGLHPVGDEGERCTRWSCTHSVGTRWVTTMTGTSIVWRPSQPSVKSKSVRPQTSTPSDDTHVRQ